MKYFPLIILVIFLSSCKNKNNEDLTFVPDNIIPMEQMVDILTDFQLVEASLNIKRKNSQNYKDYVNFYYDFIFEKYDITPDKFKESLDYYENHLKQFEKVYEEVIAKLNEKQKEVKNE